MKIRHITAVLVVLALSACSSENADKAETILSEASESSVTFGTSAEILSVSETSAGTGWDYPKMWYIDENGTHKDLTDDEYFHFCEYFNDAYTMPEAVKTGAISPDRDKISWCIYPQFNGIYEPFNESLRNYFVSYADDFEGIFHIDYDITVADETAAVIEIYCSYTNGTEDYINDIHTVVLTSNGELAAENRK